MSQSFFQELHNTVASEHPGSGRVPMRQYIQSVQSKTRNLASSHFQTFLNTVFSAEKSARFFRTFLLRFMMSDQGNTQGDDSLRCAFTQPAYAYIPVYAREHRSVSQGRQY
jgi:hypothetical protein